MGGDQLSRSTYYLFKEVANHIKWHKLASYTRQILHQLKKKIFHITNICYIICISVFIQFTIWIYVANTSFGRWKLYVSDAERLQGIGINGSTFFSIDYDDTLAHLIRAKEIAKDEIKNEEMLKYTKLLEKDFLGKYTRDTSQ